MENILYKGLDLSHWNGTVDFEKVLKSTDHKDFMILKAGGSDKGLYTDKQFNRSYAECKRLGIYVGAYYFVGANFLGTESGIADAKRFLSIIKGKQFEFPVTLDLEITKPEDKDKATEATIAFCDYMEKNGYYVNIYASDISGFQNRLNSGSLTKYDKWVARYGSAPKFVSDYGMWQHSSSISVRGTFNTNSVADHNYAYKDYPSIIKNAGLNGYCKSEKEVEEHTEPVVLKKSMDELVKDILAGKYGNGEDRKQKLAAEGYTNYEEIQNEVNKAVKKDASTTTDVKRVVSAKNAAHFFESNLSGCYETTDTVNVRDGAGTEYGILCTLPRGVKVHNYGYYSKNSKNKHIWLYCQFVHKGVKYTGFISKKYLSK